MANTYRAPTEEETTTYKDALNKGLQGVAPDLMAAKAREAIEGVFGPCIFERLGKGRCQVTQRNAPKVGEPQIRFGINADLSR